MRHAANARGAGFTFLFHIAAGIASLVLFSRASDGQDVAGELTPISPHPAEMGVVVTLLLFQGFSAIVPAVTLYAGCHVPSVPTH
jgi:hypothetical protein